MSDAARVYEFFPPGQTGPAPGAPPASVVRLHVVPGDRRALVALERWQFPRASPQYQALSRQRAAETIRTLLAAGWRRARQPPRAGDAFPTRSRC